MSNSNENTELKEDLISRLREEKIIYEIAEKDNEVTSKSIARCMNVMQKQAIEKIIGRSNNKKKIARSMAIFSKEISQIIVDIEMMKQKQPSLIPNKPIRTYTQKYQQLSDDMANLIFYRSMQSIEQREQDLIKRQKKITAKVNDILNKNIAARALIKTGKWKDESNILILLLKESRKQANFIDMKDNLQQKHIQELQKTINTLKETLNNREKENADIQADL